MSDEEFSRHKKALADQKLEKPKKLSTRHDKIWNEIYNQRYNFNRVDIEVEALENLTRDDILEFYDKYIAIEAKERRKLAVHVTSTVESDEPSQDNDKISNDMTGQRISDVIQFKASHQFKAISQPFVDLDNLKRSLDPTP